MICEKCGAEIENDSIVCSKCGNQIKNQMKGENDKISVGLIVLSVLIPIAGIIIGTINLCKKKTKTGIVYLMVGVITWAIVMIGQIAFTGSDKMVIPSKIEQINKKLPRALLGQNLKTITGIDSELSNFVDSVNVNRFKSKLLYSDVKDGYERYIVFDEMEYTIIGFDKKAKNNFITFILWKNGKCYVDISNYDATQGYPSCKQVQFDYKEAKNIISSLINILDAITYMNDLDSF